MLRLDMSFNLGITANLHLLQIITLYSGQCTNNLLNCSMADFKLCGTCIGMTLIRATIITLRRWDMQEKMYLNLGGIKMSQLMLSSFV